MQCAICNVFILKVKGSKKKTKWKLVNALIGFTFEVPNEPILLTVNLLQFLTTQAIRYLVRLGHRYSDGNSSWSQPHGYSKLRLFHT